MTGTEKKQDAGMSQLENLIFNYLNENCPDCCMAKEKLAIELAKKISELLDAGARGGKCQNDQIS